jgi:diguanylate cyclase (GGDEF)-like protein
MECGVSGVMQGLLREESAITQVATVVLVAVCFVIAIAVVRLQRLRARVRTLEAQAVTDPLTGAFNRRHFDTCLATAIERRSRLGEPVSLLMFDVDRFKTINDTLGHPQGDAVLKALAELVRTCTRRLDVLFRIGGEEFALLLSSAHYSDAMAVAEDVRARVAGATLVAGRRVSISVGVSELRDGQSAQEWVAAADAALYDAKRSGRNRVAGSGSDARMPAGHEHRARFASMGSRDAGTAS